VGGISLHGPDGCWALTWDEFAALKRRRSPSISCGVVRSAPWEGVSSALIAEGAARG
jgi:hypothetical protein